jgi:hypothetical protein
MKTCCSALLLLWIACASASVAADPAVSGVFKGNGKPAKIAFVSAIKGEDYLDKPSIDLIFTEKDHSKDAKPKFNAGFGRFGSAIIISIHEDGSIFSCNIAHMAHRGAFSSIGEAKLEGFKLADGKIEGRLTSGGEKDAFGDKWEVDLKFATTAPKLTNRSETKPEKPKATKSDKPKAGDNR